MQVISNGLVAVFDDSAKLEVRGVHLNMKWLVIMVGVDQKCVGYDESIHSLC